MLMFGTAILAQDVQDYQGGTNDTSHFQILGTLGLGYAHNKDMSDRIEGLGDDMADTYNSTTGTNDFENDFSSALFTWGVDLEARYLMEMIGFGASIGYHSCKAESKVSGDGWVDEFTFTSTLSVVPVLGTIYYKHDLDQNSFFLLGAGLGYYMGTFHEEWKDDDTVAPDMSLDEEFDTNSIGYHVKMEYNYVMENGISFTAGILGRYVTFDDLKNDNVEILYNGDPLEVNLTGANIYLSAGLSL